MNQKRQGRGMLEEDVETEIEREHILEKQLGSETQKRLC